MPKTIFIELRGTTYTGEATDLDGFFAGGFVMPSFSEIITREQGLSEAFRKFATEEKMVSAAAQGGDLANGLVEQWGERVILRLTTNREMRLSFAQRVCEIFPTLPKTLVNYKRWQNSDGELFEDGSVRLDMQEVMTVLTTVMRETLSSFEPPPTPPQPTAQQKPAPNQLDLEEASLKRQLADLQSRRTVQGFAPAS